MKTERAVRKAMERAVRERNVINEDGFKLGKV